LIGQPNQDVRLRVLDELRAGEEGSSIKWIPTSRVSVDHADANWTSGDRDCESEYKLAFFDLTLDERDRAEMERIRTVNNPDLSVRSFSCLRFAQEFKKEQPKCAVIFISDIEHRGLVIHLLSREINGDWVIQKDPLSHSLMSLLVKLFVIDNQ
jgi:hypothetical protein